MYIENYYASDSNLILQDHFNFPLFLTCNFFL